MVKPSSDSLNPVSGARFALKRIGATSGENAQQALEYHVEVFAEKGETLEGTLRLPSEGKATLEGLPEEHWAYQETLKLARVLKKSRAGSLLRWRPSPG